MRIGRDCRIGASAVIDGWTQIGDANEIFPMASVGLIPQDLKFGGERTQLVIGNRNVIREFVTIHRGTAGGGGLTSIGDHNLFMAYAHIAHDCHVGNDTIFGNGATLAGHVIVEDYANVGAFSGVHQFCRVGRHAFIGGYSVVTKDALPFAKTVGNRARIYGLNTIGLVRRKFSPDAIAKLRRAYRHLLHSNTSRALAQIERDQTVQCDEVQYVVDFIRTSSRASACAGRAAGSRKSWTNNREDNEGERTNCLACCSWRASSQDAMTMTAPTAPTTPAPAVTETFTGNIAPNGATTHTFSATDPRGGRPRR